MGNPGNMHGDHTVLHQVNNGLSIGRVGLPQDLHPRPAVGKSIPPAVRGHCIGGLQLDTGLRRSHLGRPGLPITRAADIRGDIEKIPRSQHRECTLQLLQSFTQQHQDLLLERCPRLPGRRAAGPLQSRRDAELGQAQGPHGIYTAVGLFLAERLQQLQPLLPQTPLVLPISLLSHAKAQRGQRKGHGGSHPLLWSLLDVGGHIEEASGPAAALPAEAISPSVLHALVLEEFQQPSPVVQSRLRTEFFALLVGGLAQRQIGGLLNPDILEPPLAP
mmetsp:Transcript_21649/g.49297  ORF Transcript_21649/g.49297 Transcript_21649/m.49297 type:complete len:275 (-) Transcript_21649:339-1163(-)